MNPLNIGIIGCGAISAIYAKNLSRRWDCLTLSACANRTGERAEKLARTHGLRWRSIEQLLADPSIDIICNLTAPSAHTALNRAALAAGKHVYCEKPLALNRTDARELLQDARRRGLHVGCAPDTFLGAGIQTCKQLIESGAIGRVCSALAFMMCPGHERWHPSPGFYYQPGGGPMLDMGPYYVSALVQCIGPARQVRGAVSSAFDERIVGAGPSQGARIPVRTATHATGAITFDNGALATVVMSFDVWKSETPRIEIHGTRGSLRVPDPNTFGGPVMLYRPDQRDWRSVPLIEEAPADNARGIGIADMARATHQRRQARTSGAFAAHVLDIMLAFEESSAQGRTIDMDDQWRRAAAAAITPAPDNALRAR
jgi:predicted dehydrogenase